MRLGKQLTRYKTRLVKTFKWNAEINNTVVNCFIDDLIY
jgi:hypothetical protein